MQRAGAQIARSWIATKIKIPATASPRRLCELPHPASRKECLDSSLTTCKHMRVSARRRHLPRLSPKELLILELLVGHDDMYGLAMVTASRRRLKRGTVYVTLGRMEEKGYIASRL